MTRIDSPTGVTPNRGARSSGRRLSAPGKCGTRLASSEDIARGPAGLRRAYQRFLRLHFPPPAEAHVEYVNAGGIPLVRVRAAATGNAAGATAGKQTRIPHLHGGG